jgi:DNA-binding transcriptional ArsR family regulator
MLYATPKLSAASRRQLVELDRLLERLGRDADSVRPWSGALRRAFRAIDVGSSTAIEGHSVPEDELVALVDGRDPVDPDDVDRMAVSCYARAMDHVSVMANDPSFRWCACVIKDLHFDACFHDVEARFGRWREAPVSVTDGSGGFGYRAPDHEDVAGLMGEVVEWIDHGDLDAHVAVRAAMAHLHVVSVHPFADGNGRVSRIVQSLVLARDGVHAPELSSIEQYLGEHTGDYYAALGAVQRGSYQPQRDASPFVHLCIDAHLAQAKRRLALVEAAGRRWTVLDDEVERRGWPDRLAIALEQSFFGPTDRARYTREAGVSPATASSDLRRLLDAGLLRQHGRGRSVRYQATDELRALVDTTA